MTTHPRNRRVWPLRLAAREGVATARTGRWTSTLMVIAVAWVVAAGAADALGVTALVEREREWIDAGGHVSIVTGASFQSQQNPVPTAACEGLAAVEGVTASFALTRGDTMAAFFHAPGNNVTVVSVTPGITQFLDLKTREQPVVVATAALAERTGVKDGEVVSISARSAGGGAIGTSDALTLHIVDTAALSEDLDGAMLMPTAMGSEAGECYVRTDSAHKDAVAAMLPSALAYEGMPATARPRITPSDFAIDFSTAFQERDLRWLWVPSAALLGLLWGMVQWFRRSHLAIYATFGMRAAPRLAMQASEWGVFAGIGVLWGWSLGVVGAVAAGARVEQALVQVTAHAVLTVLGASVLVVLLGLRPTGTLLNTLKDR